MVNKDAVISTTLIATIATIATVGVFTIALINRKQPRSTNCKKPTVDVSPNVPSSSSCAETRIKELETALDKESRIAKSEREVRMRMQTALGEAEKRLASLSLAKSVFVLPVDADDGDAEKLAAEVTEIPPILPIPTIGIVQSAYTTRNGTPRQPSLITKSRAKLTLHKSIPAACLKDLHSYSHVWVVFFFHQNTNLHKGTGLVSDTPSKKSAAKGKKKGGNTNVVSGWKALVKPPRGGGISVGCLATRSPHRPSALGLSLARVVEVYDGTTVSSSSRSKTQGGKPNGQQGYVILEGLDLVHGTPVVDIKPYIPFCDAPAKHSNYFTPPWVGKEDLEAPEADPMQMGAVFLAPDAKTQLSDSWKMACKHIKGSGANLYTTAEEFVDFVIQNLQLDFRSLRERHDPKLDKYRVTLCDVVIWYKLISADSIKGGDIVVEKKAEGGEKMCVYVVGAELVNDETAQPLNEFSIRLK
ncbi:hypothetical protein HDV05_003103 [Chytridiales sp. JEL 0842]|nr:hypothetical protein HDV05_003103 [Chytridiales sp. JEL 0842]